jgi:hypothetical protein
MAAHLSGLIRTDTGGDSRSDRAKASYPSSPSISRILRAKATGRSVVLMLFYRLNFMKPCKVTQLLPATRHATVAKYKEKETPESSLREKPHFAASPRRKEKRETTQYGSVPLCRQPAQRFSTLRPRLM